MGSRITWYISGQLWPLSAEAKATTVSPSRSALESVAAVPLPARCGFWAVPGGVAVEVVAPPGDPGVRRQVADALEARGVPLRELYLHADRGQLRRPFPLRGDLKEAMFPVTTPSSISPLSLPELVRA